MTNQPNLKRNPSASKGATGIKLLIMAGSLAATIGGWGILALGQARDTWVAAQQIAPVSQPASPALQQNLQLPSPTTAPQGVAPAPRQVTAPVQAPRPVGRTRSSR